MIYGTPPCGTLELAALERVEELWRQLRYFVANEHRRWFGSMRRVLAAVATQGSNGIEGFNVSTEDAVAAMQGAIEPRDSNWEDWQAVQGYQRSMTFVLQLANDEHFEYSSGLLRSLHFMMTEHGLDAGPGLWRPGAIWVRNDLTGEMVYEAPDADYVPPLVDELIVELKERTDDVHAIVSGAMAHLNLVLIHPYKDGNGRMARCLQSLVLVRNGFLAREFCSIEEYLGQPRNTERYYDMLREVGRGRWSPENDARPWVRYCIEAHYIQAQSVLRRVRESERLWTAVEEVIEATSLPPRTFAALFDAAIGLRVRNSIYRATLDEWAEEISNQTATLDLRAMVEAGLLEQQGVKRGTYYVASERLRGIAEKVRGARTPLDAGDLFEVDA